MMVEVVEFSLCRCVRPPTSPFIVNLTHIMRCSPSVWVFQVKPVIYFAFFARPRLILLNALKHHPCMLQSEGIRHLVRGQLCVQLHVQYNIIVPVPVAHFVQS